MKRCPKCGIEKDEACFVKDKHRSGGLYPYCKDCVRAKSTEYRIKFPEKMRDFRENYEASFPERVRESKRKWNNSNLDYFANYCRNRMAIDPEYAEMRRGCWTRSNQKKSRSGYHRLYRAANRDRMQIYQKEWDKTPKGILRRIRGHQKRQEREKSVISDLTDAQLKFLIRWQENKCARCEAPFSDDVEMTIDHIIPVSKGGNLTFENVQLLCRSCNSHKNNHTIMYRQDFRFYYFELT